MIDWAKNILLHLEFWRKKLTQHRGDMNQYKLHYTKIITYTNKYGLIEITKGHNSAIRWIKTELYTHHVPARKHIKIFHYFFLIKLFYINYETSSTYNFHKSCSLALMFSFVWEETGVIKREQNLTYKYWDMTWQGIIMMSSISGVIIKVYK